MESLMNTLSFFQCIENFKTDLLAGDSTVLLSPHLLNHVNKTLTNLEVCGAIDKVEIPFQDKILLYEVDAILKSAPNIKISQKRISSDTSLIDLSRCWHVKRLEFCRIPLDLVTGQEVLSISLTCLIIQRCSHPLRVFSSVKWDNLVNLTINYSNLSVIEDGAFEDLKSVTNLDLSFNQLTNIQGICGLLSLKNVNLSFNSLEAVPVFSLEASSTIENLDLSHNNLTDTNGIEHLLSLRTLYLNDNCIIFKRDLQNLYYLKYLKALSLSANPLSFNKYYRMYVVHFLGTTLPPLEFVLDNSYLKDAELDFIGTFRGKSSSSISHPVPDKENKPGPSKPQAEQFIEGIRPPSILKASNRSRRARDVDIIESASGEIIPGKVPRSKKISSQKTKVSQKLVKFEENPDDSTVVPSPPRVSTPLIELPDELANSSTISPIDFYISDVEKNSDEAAYSSGIQVCNGDKKFFNHCSYPVVQNSSPEASIGESCTVEVTVHVSEKDLVEHGIQDRNLDQNVSKNVDLGKDTSTQDTSESNTTMDEVVSFVTCDSLVNTSYEEPLSTPIDSDCYQDKTTPPMAGNASVNTSSDESEIENDNLTGEENLWPVKVVVDSKVTDIFLVLLESELKERSTVTGRTISNYPLAFVQRCMMVQDDPVTIEIEFMSLFKQKTVRTYIMEFPDSQTLLKKMSNHLGNLEKPTKFKCKSCDTIFKKDPDLPNNIGRTVCPSCESVAVEELPLEEHLPPVPEEVPVTVEEPFSRSSSQSSIVATSASGTENCGSPHNNTNQSSAVSSETSEKSTKTSDGFHKYESDIEIISNPSQSSIEVLDEQARSPGTPSRKRSVEERFAIPSDLPTVEEFIGTVPEIVPPIDKEQSMDTSLLKPSDPVPQLTESSSSGSVSESVVTTYETSITSVKQLSDSGIEDLPDLNQATANLSTDVTITESSEKNEQGAIDEKEEKIVDEEVLFFGQITGVDHRIKEFLYQYVFSDEAEEITLLIKCHVWKTGGTDYPGLFVLSTSKLYVIKLSTSANGLDASDWLSLKESNDLKSIKQVFALAWYQGVGVQVNHLYFLLLVQNKSVTEKILESIKGLSLKSCDIQSKSSSKIEMALQQIVLSNSYVQEVIDPTVLLYSICNIVILKDDEVHEMMKLCGFIVTSGEFYIAIGDMGWMYGTSNFPTIDFYQRMSSLIEVDKRGCELRLHFLDESEAQEEVWALTCANRTQVETIIDSMKAPWENLFSVPLEITETS